MTCPRCQNVYQFRSPSAAPTPSACSPVAAPVQPPPLPALATPATAQAPVAVPVAAPIQPAPGLEFDPPAEVVRNPYARGRVAGRAHPRRLPSAFLVLALGTALAGMGWYLSARNGQESSDDARSFRTAGNFAFRSVRGWRSDGALRQKMRVNLALTRRGPRGHMTLAYRDYKFRVPAEGELLDEALARLRLLFSQVQYEDPLTPENRLRRRELDGVPALVFPFAAIDPQEVPIHGQCWMLSRQGYGYWLFFWGPEEDTALLEPGWERLRAGFQLLDEREGWKPRARPREPIALVTVPLQLEYASDVWRKESNPGDYDEKAVLVLRGFEPTEDEETGKKRVVEYAGKAATVQILVLPRADHLEAGFQAARLHIEKRKKELYPEVKLEPIVDRKSGKPVVVDEVGVVKGRVGKFRVQLDRDNEHYAVLAVVNDPDGLVVLVGECRGERHGFWDAEFMALLETVRPRR